MILEVLFEVHDISTRWPTTLIDATSEIIRVENGSTLDTPKGPMVVVSHENHWYADKQRYIRQIYVVPMNCYAPVRNIKHVENPLIGYYQKPYSRQICRVHRQYYSYKDTLIDNWIEEQLSKQGSVENG